MQVQKPHLEGTTYLFLSIIVIIASVIVACGNLSSSGPEGHSQLNLYLTDAPAEYQEVNVDVQHVQIRYLGTGDPDEAEAAAEDEDGGWIDLPVEPFRINLLDLTDTDMLIATADDLEPGYYNELRLVLGEDNAVMIGGEIHTLNTPSAQESGYKIKFGTRLESGEVLDLTLDFDAERSVVVAGKSGKYLLKPVLKAFEGRIDNTDG